MPISLLDDIRGLPLWGSVVLGVIVRAGAELSGSQRKHWEALCLHEEDCFPPAPKCALLLSMAGQNHCLRHSEDRSLVLPVCHPPLGCQEKQEDQGGSSSPEYGTGNLPASMKTVQGKKSTNIRAVQILALDFHNHE